MTTRNGRIGRRGEDLALTYLEQRGLKLLERNFRVGHREIDLIMESEGKIHIVEVKTLVDSTADPTDRVDSRKIGLIASAARFFVASRRIYKEIQFDVVSIVIKGMDFEIEYLPDAFTPVYYK